MPKQSEVETAKRKQKKKYRLIWRYNIAAAMWEDAGNRKKGEISTANVQLIGVH